MTAESAISALVFEEDGNGKLEVQCVLLRTGNNQERIAEVASRAFKIFAEQIDSENRGVLDQYNPGSPDA